VGVTDAVWKGGPAWHVCGGGVAAIGTGQLSRRGHESRRRAAGVKEWSVRARDLGKKL
jgi:hypothetical protein